MFKQRDNPPDVLKAKFADRKRQPVRRLRSLKEFLLLDAVTVEDKRDFLRTAHRDIFWVAQSAFVKVAAELRGKAERGKTPSDSLRSELFEYILFILETLIFELPDVFHMGFQLDAMRNILAAMLSTANTIRLRQAGLRLLIIWIAALQDQCPAAVLALFSNALGIPSVTVSPELGPAAAPPLIPAPPGEEAAAVPKLADSFLEILSSLIQPAPVATGNRAEALWATSHFLFVYELWTSQYLVRFYPGIARRCGFQELNVALSKPQSSGKSTPSHFSGGSSGSTAASTASATTAAAAATEADPRDMACSWAIHDIVVRWYVRWLVNAEFKPIRMELFLRQCDLEFVHGLFRLSIRMPLTLGEVALDTSPLFETIARIMQVYQYWMQHEPVIGESSCEEFEVPRFLKSPSKSNLTGGTSSNSGGGSEPGHTLPQKSPVALAISSSSESIPAQSLDTSIELAPATEGVLSEDETDVEDALNVSWGNSSCPEPSLQAVLSALVHHRGTVIRLHADDRLYVSSFELLQHTFEQVLANTSEVLRCFNTLRAKASSPVALQRMLDLCQEALCVFQLVALRQLAFMDPPRLELFLQVLLEVISEILDGASDPIATSSAFVKSVAGLLFETLLCAWIRVNVYEHMPADMWRKLQVFCSRCTGWPELIATWEHLVEHLTSQLAHAWSSLDLANLGSSQELEEQGLPSSPRSPLSPTISPGAASATGALNPRLPSGPKMGVIVHSYQEVLAEFQELSSLFAQSRKNATYLWTNAIGILGNINRIEYPRSHAIVVSVLCKTYSTLRRVLTKSSVPTSWLPHYFPWLVQAALGVGPRFKESRYRACQMVCQIMLERSRCDVSPDNLSRFYQILLQGMRDDDRDIVYVILETIPQFFTYNFSGAPVLIFDFLTAIRNVLGHGFFQPQSSLSDLLARIADRKTQFSKRVPRLEAISLFCSLACFPSVFRGQTLTEIREDITSPVPSTTPSRGSESEASASASDRRFTLATRPPLAELRGKGTSAPQTPARPFGSGDRMIPPTPHSSDSSKRRNHGSQALLQHANIADIASPKRSLSMSFVNRRSFALSEDGGDSSIRTDSLPSVNVSMVSNEELPTKTFDDVRAELLTGLRAIVIEETDTVTRRRAIAGLGILATSELLNNGDIVCVFKSLDAVLAFLRSSDQTVARTAISVVSMFSQHYTAMVMYNMEYPHKILKVLNRALSHFLLSDPSGEVSHEIVGDLLLALRDWLLVVPGSETAAMRSIVRAAFDVLIEASRSERNSELLRDQANMSVDFQDSSEVGEPTLLDYMCDEIEALSVQPEATSSGRNSTSSRPGQARSTPRTQARRRHLTHQAANVIVEEEHSEDDHSREAQLPKLNRLASFILLQLMHKFGSKSSRQGVKFGSIICEDDDLADDTPGSDLKLFALNSSVILSVMERSSYSRLILRDTAGKYTWDVTNVEPDVFATSPRECLSKLRVALASTNSAPAPALSPNAGSALRTASPLVNVAEKPRPLVQDNLADVLAELGVAASAGFKLPEADAAGEEALEKQAQALNELAEKSQAGGSAEASCTGGSTGTGNSSGDALTKIRLLERQSVHISALTTQSIHFLIDLGIVSWGNRQQLVPLNTSEKLFRELRMLDKSGIQREHHKLAIIYVPPGATDQRTIIAAEQSSEAFVSFVKGLGWFINLDEHIGYAGNIKPHQFPNCTAPYYATDALELFFHVTTMMNPGEDCSAQELFNKRWVHIGNDDVHIVFSEQGTEFETSLLQTKFGEVTLVVYLLEHQLFRIQVILKTEIPAFGPLYDGAVVDLRSLPSLLRFTAINAGRALRSKMAFYEPYYESRENTIQRIIHDYSQPTSFAQFTRHITRLRPASDGALAVDIDAAAQRPPSPSTRNRSASVTPVIGPKTAWSANDV
eukprot:m.155336 g.155336  ORF g.155336 m.155336 type:complete len:1904 (-) comp10203_c0_seq6:138-5849(-)